MMLIGLSFLGFLWFPRRLLITSKHALWFEAAVSTCPRTKLLSTNCANVGSGSHLSSLPVSGMVETRFFDAPDTEGSATV